MRPTLLAFILLFAAFAERAHAAPAVVAPNPSAAEVFALINDYRASNGLYALVQHNILMQTAQGQSDYQASIAQVTHGGPGGSRPRDRAYAAGYGGGQVVFISELVTGGFNQTPEGALTWWKNSPEHNSYLLSSNYFDLGIGVATDSDGRYYYTAVLGNIAGGTYDPEEAEAAAAITPQAVMIPVAREEPRENGALVHIVRQGQALWTIAAVYEVPLDVIYELNNLSAASFIFPGDEIIVAPEGTYTQQAATEQTETDSTETPTARPTSAPTARATSQELAVAQSDADDSSTQGGISTEAQAAAKNTTVKWIVGLALASILAVLVASFFIQKPRGIETADDDPFAPID